MHEREALPREWTMDPQTAAVAASIERAHESLDRCDVILARCRALLERLEDGTEAEAGPER